MPHLTMEYSANILEEDQLPRFLADCHTILAENLPANIADCKSRAYPCTNYLVGAENESEQAFVAIEIRVLTGRAPDKLQTTIEKVLQQAKHFFQQSQQALKLQISVELNELSKHYVKS